ncbi:hypothetical protein [Spongiimicrobium sp. 3-5]|uniref:hypothetical protein n=1 Tax=Spongiimicrobium sp. 3-5 TaxID=3332596 RepID=UPI0039813CCF
MEKKYNYTQEMDIKLITLFLIGLITFSCASEQSEMNEGETYLAEKLSAEWISIGLTQTETKTDGKITENRKFINVVIKNSSDIEKIIEETDYAEKKMKNVAQFVLDSIQFGELTFKPEEIRIEFIKDDSFLIFQNERKQSMSFNLD